MQVELLYGIIFGKGDSSDPGIFDVELSEEEEKAYWKARMTGIPFDEVEELNAVLERVYPEIEQETIEELIDNEIEEVMYRYGLVEMDAEELNHLVHTYDSHALAFFDLTNAEKQIIDSWDAGKLTEIPLVKDFKENFIPDNPFDDAWELRVWFSAEYDCPTNKEIESYIMDALLVHDIELVHKVVNEQAICYDGDIDEVALELAKTVGCFEYRSE